VHCLKVVDKAITMVNLWLLCPVVNVCRGTARRPRYKYSITARWKFYSEFINWRLNAKYLPSYRLICQEKWVLFFWYFEVRVRYRRKKVHVRYLISWWVLVVFSFSLFFVSVQCARLRWPSRQVKYRPTVIIGLPHRVVSYSDEKTRFPCLSTACSSYR